MLERVATQSFQIFILAEITNYDGFPPIASNGITNAKEKNKDKAGEIAKEGKIAFP